MAHASVASLVRTIESLLTSNSPMQSLTCDHGEDFSALHEKISSLEVFLKNFEKNNISGEMTDLELQVKEVANIVEHTIQVRVTEVLEDDENQREKAQERLSDSLLLVAEEIDRIWKESTKIQNKGKHALKESTAQEFPCSSRNILNVEYNMVGRDDQRKRLVQDLTRSYSGEPKVIPIVGMGGIGKTTLANEVYNDACIRSHFDVCAWATVSQQHNVKEILLSLLRSTKGDTFDMNDEAELANMLQKSLKGKRYLIVLDDMWKSEAWDAVRLCFPSENKGSGILLTTRNTDVAHDAGTYILWPRTLPASTPSAKSFPATLKKLNLTSTYLSWSYLDIIAELPNLEVLKLMGFACCGEGEEWHPIVMGFNRLKILLIERSFLKYWKATYDIPVLERLVLINCKCLKEIPIEFAKIHSLQLIEVDLCLIELGESAARIQQEQQDLGNNPLDVRIS
ncbi:hypothetical protein BC332_17880, partial [Capsicum chinense]